MLHVLCCQKGSSRKTKMQWYMPIESSMAWHSIARQIRHSLTQHSMT